MTDKIMKHALRIVLQLLIDIVIVLLLIQVFNMGYSFSYKVFTDSCVDLRDDSQIAVTIPPDSTTMEIVDELLDAGVIEDKYVMIAKIYLSSYHGKLLPGTYMLSKSMTQDEIMKSLAGIDEEEEDAKQ